MTKIVEQASLLAPIVLVELILLVEINVLLVKPVLPVPILVTAPIVVPVPRAVDLVESVLPVVLVLSIICRLLSWLNSPCRVALNILVWILTGIVSFSEDKWTTILYSDSSFGSL